MYRIIHKNYAHHHPATPIMSAGKWKVYNVDDVEEGWPGGDFYLALDMSSAHIERLKSLGDTDPDAKWELPVKESEPQSEAEEHVEANQENFEEELTIMPERPQDI